MEKTIGGARAGSGRKGMEDRRELHSSVQGRHVATLDRYMKKHKLRTRSEAIRRMIERAETQLDRQDRRAGKEQ